MLALIITISKNPYNSLLHCLVQDEFAMTAYPRKIGSMTGARPDGRAIQENTYIVFSQAPPTGVRCQTSPYGQLYLILIYAPASRSNT